MLEILKILPNFLLNALHGCRYHTMWVLHSYKIFGRIFGISSIFIFLNLLTSSSLTSSPFTNNPFHFTSKNKRTQVFYKVKVITIYVWRERSVKTNAGLAAGDDEEMGDVDHNTKEEAYKGLYYTTRGADSS